MRWKWIALAIVIAALVIWWWRRSEPRPAKRTAKRAPVGQMVNRAAIPAPAPRDTLPPGFDPTIYQPPNAPPLSSKPGTAMMFAPMTEYKYDPEQIKNEELEYKRYRLRFKLADAAAECHDGDDRAEDIRLSYTMVVRSEELTIEDVRVVESTIPDAAVQACIVDAIKGMRSSAKGLPDLRQDNESYLSLHDLYVRNRAAGDAP